MLRDDDDRAYQWLLKRTENIQSDGSPGNAAYVKPTIYTVVMAVVAVFCSL